MKKKGTKNITFTQRLQIEGFLRAKLSKKQIAQALGLCLSAVYKEIKRGLYQHLDGATWLYETKYSANKAQDLCNLNMTAKGAPLKIGNDYEYLNYIESKVIKDKLSPGAVLGEIKHKNLVFKTTISKTTFYRYIRLGLFQHLSMKDIKTKQKRNKKVTSKRAPRGISIEKRPYEINSRSTFGHWEMDCVCGPTKTSFLTLTERLTRKEIIFKMPNQTSASVVKCLNILERKYGKLFKNIFQSITVDNGSEFADCQGMEKSIFGKNSKRTTCYYCHPYCSSERGSNERLNREIRRLVPKGTNLAKYTDSQVKEIETWVNNYPRQIFGFETSAERYKTQLSLIA